MFDGVADSGEGMADRMATACLCLRECGSSVRGVVLPDKGGVPGRTTKVGSIEEDER